MKKITLSFVSVFIMQIALAQTVVSGKIIDQSTQEPVPFASIGIKGKTAGTLSDENGVFSIELKDFAETDSLKFSAIGYRAQSFAMSSAKNFCNKTISLYQTSVVLNEVVVKPTKTITKVLGNKKYNTNVQCTFQGNEKNFLGVEAAIRANNKKGRTVWIEDFNFYITKNLVEDSVTFRLNFYKENSSDLPGENILSKPIIFKTKQKNGVVHLDLKKLNIHTDDDFYISLECLSSKVTKDNFAFSGSIMGPAYFKMATFMNWEKIPVMGLDFNVTVTYQK